MVAAVVLAAVVTAGAGALIGILIDRRLAHHSAVIAMVATLGAGIVLSQITQQAWGTSAALTNVIGLAPIRLGALTLDRINVWASVAAVALAAAVTVFLRFSRTGLAIRAVADSADGARISGIPAGRMRAVSWAIGAALAAVSGFFVAVTISPLSPDFMDLYMVSALLAAVIGGLGSLTGAVLGAMAISVAQSLFGSYAPSLTFGSKFIFLGTFTQTFLLLLLIVVLLALPRGLLGGRVTRGV